MRLTRGCRAGGGVACSSLEYGGIRAATSRTPAPRAPLSLSLSLLATSPNALPHPFYSSSSPLLAVSLGNVASALPFPPIPPLVLVHLELSLSLFLHLYSSQSCPLSSFESLRCSLPSSSLTVNARDNDETTRALPILAPVFSSRPYPPLLLFRLETHSRGTMGGGGCGGGGGEKEDQAC